MDNDTTIDGTPASLEGQTIGVVKDTASAKVLKSVVPGATLNAEELHHPQGSVGRLLQG